MTDSDTASISQEEIARAFDVLPERQAKIASILSSMDNDMHSYCRPAVEEGAVYCYCRTSDTSRFMICCDQCNVWYHGDCVSITELEANNISQYFCDTCRAEDPSLSTKYKHKKTKHKNSKKKVKKDLDFDDPQNLSKKSSRRCGECISCYRTEDCGRCDFCKGLIIGKITKPKHHKRDSSFTLESDDATMDFEDEDYDQVLRDITDDQDGVYEPYCKKSSKDKKSSSKKKLKGKPKDKKSKTSQHRSRKRDDRHHRDSGRDKHHDKSHGSKIQQCYGPGCANAARSGSKYCSDDCGMRLATNRIYEILPQRIQQWNSSTCTAEENNKLQLEKVRRQQLEARQVLQELDKRNQDLEALIERAKSTTILADQENNDAEEETELSVYCVTCGHEVGARTALRHMEKCFNKNESQSSFGSVFKTRIEGNNMFCDFYSPQQRTYCKRLRVLCPEHSKEPKINDDEVCGYPLVVDVFTPSGEFCRVPKKKCMKHHCWEKLRRAEIDMERVREWLRLDDLFEQERSIRTAMANRAGVLGLMLHSTVDHSALMAVPPQLQVT